MFCRSCGREIPDDSAVCMYCGTLMSISTLQPIEEPASEYRGKFNIIAGLVPPIWALVKGMWDMAVVFLLYNVLCTAIAGIPIIGALINAVLVLIEFIWVGRNANYFYWLKTVKGISFLSAMRNPILRRF